MEEAVLLSTSIMLDESDDKPSVQIRVVRTNTIDLIERAIRQNTQLVIPEIIDANELSEYEPVAVATLSMWNIPGSVEAELSETTPLLEIGKSANAFRSCPNCGHSNTKEESTNIYTCRYCEGESDTEY